MYEQRVIASSKDLTKKDLLRLKDTSAALKLNDEVKADGSKLRLIITGYAFLEVETDSETFKKLVLTDSDMNQYQTGSEVLGNSIVQIFEDLGDEIEDGVVVDIFKKKSKNQNGSFLNAVFVDTWRKPEAASDSYEV